MGNTRGTYRNRKWLRGASAALALAVFLPGCANNPGDTQNDSLKPYSGPVKVKTLEQTRAEERAAASVVPIARIHNADYVSLGDAARAIGFHAEWLPDGRYGIGDRDPSWTLRTGESTAGDGGRTVRMTGPAVRQNGQLYVPLGALQQLFGKTAKFRAEGGQVSFYPQPPGSDNGADDLAMPFKDAAQPNGSGPGIRAQSAGGGDASEVISEARKYLGVKYDFGASDYSQSRKFDCSSFTQYIFAKFGVNLPRTAREQGQLGSSVPRSELRPGDLVFFSVPGRFKSDNTVGHVGIYMGNGEMINANTAPEDGVQITDINKEYWQNTFLFAKRVL